METKDSNPLLCEIETGMCEMPGDKEKDSVGAFAQATQKPVKVIYYTDPICSSSNCLKTLITLLIS